MLLLAPGPIVLVSGADLWGGTPQSVTLARTILFGAGADQTVEPTGIASAEAFGAPSLHQFLNIEPTGIASEEAFGTPTVEPGPVEIAPTGIVSGEAFGTPDVSATEQTVEPTGIASEEAFGAAKVQQVIRPTGIPSGEYVGTPEVIAAAPAPPGDVDPAIPEHADLDTAWQSATMIGALRPHMVVEVRDGRWARAYRTLSDSDEEIDATIPGEDAGHPWMAVWEPAGEWTQIDGTGQVQIQQTREQRGVVCTVDLENVRLVEHAGVDESTYHTIERGYISPNRGFAADGRPSPPAAANEWEGVLRKHVQIRVWHGYGEPQRNLDGTMPGDGGTNGAWMFSGHVDDLDLEALPDRATITARNGQTLTDQHLFGWATSKQLKDPTVFSDRLNADEVTKVGADADASSSRAGSPASAVLDDSNQSAWRSDDHTIPGVTEWVEIRVPPGRYTDFILHPAYDGMELYIGFYGHGTVTADGVDVGEGWVDLNGGAEVPGAFGGWEYLRHIERVSDSQMTRKLGATIEVTEESVLRCGFRNLRRISEDVYRAGVIRLQARKRVLNDEAAEHEWILVDDAADVVKVVLRWAGFREWSVESTGARLKGKTVLNRGSTLMDVINGVCQQTGYEFYFTPPVDGDRLPIPVFRQNRARFKPDSVREITDATLLTGIGFKETQEPLAYVVRIRGKHAADEDGGTQLGGDLSRRLMGVYRPPWSHRLDGTGTDRLSGKLTHVTLTRPALKTLEECMVMCRLVALNEALAASQAVARTPGLAGIGVNDQIGVQDGSTAVNSRLWVAEWTSEFQTGAATKWTTSFTGPLLDTDDLVQIIAELEGADGGESGTTLVAEWEGNRLIPDDDDRGIAIPLPIYGPGVVAAVTVNLWLEHEYMQDVFVGLEHEDGTQATLFSWWSGEEQAFAWGSNANLANFTDAASTPVADAVAPYDGTYEPAESFVSFAGKKAAGTWRLRVLDQLPGDAGKVKKVTLEVTIV